MCQLLIPALVNLKRHLIRTFIYYWVLLVLMQYITTLKIYSNGRVTIPDYIRQSLRLKDGDLVKVIVERTDEETNI